MGMRHRPDGRWEFRATVDGRRVSLYAPTRGELAQLVADEKARGGGEILPSNPITVAQHAEQWLKSSVLPNRKRTTYAQYETMICRYIIPTIGHIRLTELRSHHIDQMYADLRAGNIDEPIIRFPLTTKPVGQVGKTNNRGKVKSQASHVGKATMQRVHLVLRRLLDTAADRRIIPWSPLKGITPPTHKNSEMRVLDTAQLRRLIAAAKGDRYEALYLLAAISGLRQGEVFALRWDDINFKKRTVRIERSLQDVNGTLAVVSPKTLTSSRTIDVDERTIQALLARLDASVLEDHSSPFVFTTASGGFMRKANFRSREFHAMLRRASTEDDVIMIRFHDLRHTAATTMLSAGVPVKVVSERLGHASVRFTLDRYAHVLPGMGREAADQVQAYIDGDDGVTNGVKLTKEGAPPQL